MQWLQFKANQSMKILVIIWLKIVFIITLNIPNTCFAEALGIKRDTETWFISNLKPNSAFIDLSYLNDPPAGKHGFLKVSNGGFVFEDGKEIKLWGVALSAGACFPDKKDARALAKRLAGLGFNLIRLHHMDAPWAGRSLIQYKGRKDSRHFNYKNWDRLDYLINALKEEGIYIYLDMLSSRQFKEGDGIPGAPDLPYNGKGISLIHPLLIELQKEFAEKVWNHINPYTGLRYKNDPVMALTLITNENDVTSHFFLTKDNVPGHPNIVRLFQDRLEEYAADQHLNKRMVRRVWSTSEGRRATNWIMISYFREMSQHLRKIGVKIPITGTNWALNLHDLPSLVTMDFMDQHIYAEGGLHDADYLMSPFKRSTSLQRLSFARIHGKPFVVSEWNKDYPKVYRGEYPVTFAAVAAFQGWNAAILYSYAHDTWVHPYLHHPNDVIVDPARLPLIPIASIVFRRGVKTSKFESIVSVKLDEIYSGTFLPEKMIAYRTGLWQKRLSLSWNEKLKGVDPMKNFLEKNTRQIESPDGQLIWNWHKGYRLINTPFVQAFVGKGKGEKRKTKDVVFQFENEFCSVAVASIGNDALPIKTAKKLWITVTARAKNAGEVYDFGHGGKQIFQGGGPILSEGIKGKIIIHNTRSPLQYKITLPSGKIVKSGKLKKHSDNWWILQLNPDDKTHFYEIRAGS